MIFVRLFGDEYLTPGKFSLSKLHQVIQIAMDWSDSSLHHFLVDGVYYSYPYPDSGWEETREENSRRVTLAQIAPYAKRKFVYEYDFGDSWKHEIVVEEIMSLETGAKYPQCVKGKGACPPEDVGGVWGYANFLEAIHDPNMMSTRCTWNELAENLIQRLLIWRPSTKPCSG